jgi:hypothetical protein
MSDMNYGFHDFIHDENRDELYCCLKEKKHDDLVQKHVSSLKKYYGLMMNGFLHLV